jgi:hypothetical protein
VLLLFCVLSDDSMHDGLEDILFGHNALHVFYEVVSIIDLIVLKIINNQVESCLGDHINKGWKNLKSILSTSENNEVVSQEIVVLENISSC